MPEPKPPLFDKLTELSRITAPPEPAVDAVAKNEEIDYERETKALQLEDRRHYVDARKNYSRWIFGLVVVWLVALLVIVVASGYANTKMPVGDCVGPKISDGVLIALITGTSANIIGLLTIVIMYLFPKRDNI